MCVITSRTVHSALKHRSAQWCPTGTAHRLDHLRCPLETPRRHRIGFFLSCGGVSTAVLAPVSCTAGRRSVAHCLSTCLVTLSTFRISLKAPMRKCLSRIVRSAQRARKVSLPRGVSSSTSLRCRFPNSQWCQYKDFESSRLYKQ
jgi:hypothetical protein